MTDERSNNNTPEGAEDEFETQHVAPDDPDATLALGAGTGDSRLTTNPEQIGPYTLIEPLGEGGMGTVWLARQEEPVRRDVALKVIKLGMDTRAVVGRFQAEQQALAMMNHRGIARVLDAGATEQGSPYFVMEHVPGEPINAYCDRHLMSVRERLDLFVEVCEAVQHAHQKGVVHRDLKPSNVLVTDHEGKPAPKIIDFGLAKAMDQSLSDATQTRVGEVMGTPAYMSPEQLDPLSVDIDTRTDIYSLGVMLYELLVGQLPFSAERMHSAGISGLHELIRSEDPPSLAKRLATLGDEITETAARRHAEPAHLMGQLRGDLEWVVARAMEKDRERRYPAASDLADDIRRHLGNEPVLARPASTAYRLRKFVRRRKGLVVAAAAVLVALVGGLAATTAMYLQAEERRLEAEAQKLLALGQVEFAEYPTASLAWARASLEVKDTRAGRLFALQALSQGSTARMLEPPNSEGVFHRASFSTDGEWASFDGYTNLSIEHRSGGPRRAVFEVPSSGTSGVFSFHDGSSSVVRAAKPYFDRGMQELRTYSLPGLEELSRLELPLDEFQPWSTAQKGMYLYRTAPDGGYEIFLWEAEEPTAVGTVVADDCAVEPKDEWWLCWRGQDFVLYSVADLDSEPRFIRTIEGAKRRVLLHPKLEWFVIQDPQTHVVTAWSLSDPTGGPLWSLATQGLRHLAVDATGTRIAEGEILDGTATVFVWDLLTPGADPIKLARPGVRYLNGIAFDPSGRWLVMTTVNSGTFWPLPERLTEVYSGSDIMLRVASFTPDGKSLIIAEGWSPATRVVRLQPLDEGGVESEMSSEFYGLSHIRVDPEGRFLVGGGEGVALIQPLDGSEPTRLEGFSRAASLQAVGFDAERQLVAAAPATSPADQKVIRVWSLRDGSVQVLKTEGAGEGFMGAYTSLAFLPDGDLLSCGGDGVLRWNLEDGSYETLAGPCGNDVAEIVLTPDARVAVARERGRAIAIDLDSGEVRQLEGFEPAEVVALGPKGEMVAAATRDGVIQIARLSGGEPHYLFGHPKVPRSLTFSPDGKKLISAHEGGTIRIWDVPDLSEPPLQTLPYEELMARLAAITNLQVVPDAESSTGYKLELGPFRGLGDGTELVRELGVVTELRLLAPGMPACPRRRWTLVVLRPEAALVTR